VLLRPARRHTVFQTSVMSALLDGIYDGELTIGELLEHGNFGLGTFNALDGELLVLDGMAYQLRSGDADIASDARRTPFAVITMFSADLTRRVTTTTTRAELVDMLVSWLPSQNYLYAVRITGLFRRVTTRTVVRQARPYRPLVEVTRGEPVVEHTDVAGVVAGFRTPLYERGIGVPGGHVHFIDAERRRGGHVLDFLVERATIEVCVGTDLHLALPLNPDFGSAHLDPPDLDGQVEQAERHG
jgi:acetolactate decarboxylase